MYFTSTLLSAVLFSILPANNYFAQMFYRIYLDLSFITKYNCMILISSKHLNSHTGLICWSSVQQKMLGQKPVHKIMHLYRDVTGIKVCISMLSLFDACSKVTLNLQLYHWDAFCFSFIKWTFIGNTNHIHMSGSGQRSFHCEHREEKGWSSIRTAIACVVHSHSSNAFRSCRCQWKICGSNICACTRTCLPLD